MSDNDDRIEYERPSVFNAEHRAVLYRSDGTPLRRQIGFAMTQRSSTFPELTKPGKKKGKK